MNDGLVLALCWIVGGIVSTVLYYRMWGQRNICRNYSAAKIQYAEYHRENLMEKARGEAGLILLMPFFWWVILILIAILAPIFYFIEWAERTFPTKKQNHPILDWFIGRSCDT